MAVSKRRFPPPAEILPVFAVIAVMFYGWSLVIFLYKVPGWLYYLTLSEIAGILAHQLMVNLLESLTALLLLLLVGFILPPAFFTDAFPLRGSVFAIIVIGTMMVFLVEYAAAPSIGKWLGLVLLGSLCAAIFIAILAGRFRPLGSMVLWLADRLIVFLFVLIPASVLAMVYLLLRALFL